MPLLPAPKLNVPFTAKAFPAKSTIALVWNDPNKIPGSKAPMLQADVNGRGKPRWSLIGQLAATAPPIAKLPTPRAMVCVGPSLSCNGPRLGSTKEPMQLESVLGHRRFPPPSVRLPPTPMAQFPPVALFA